MDLKKTDHFCQKNEQFLSRLPIWLEIKLDKINKMLNCAKNLFAWETIEQIEKILQ